MHLIFLLILSSIVRVIFVHLSKYGQLTWATGNAYSGILVFKQTLFCILDFNHIIQISTFKMRIIKEINQNIVLQFIKNVYIIQYTYHLTK